MNNKRHLAKKWLVYYFNVIANKAGVTLDFDCDQEIEGIVDFIIEAAVEEIKSQLEKEKRNDAELE